MSSSTILVVRTRILAVAAAELCLLSLLRAPIFPFEVDRAT